MTVADPILTELLESRKLNRYVDVLNRTLRREEAERRRFEASLREDVRAEFINGKVVIQTPARDRHTTAVRRIGTLLDTYVRVNNLGAVRSEQAVTCCSENEPPSRSGRGAAHTFILSGRGAAS